VAGVPCNAIADASNNRLGLISDGDVGGWPKEKRGEKGGKKRREGEKGVGTSVSSSVRRHPISEANAAALSIFRFPRTKRKKGKRREKGTEFPWKMLGGRADAGPLTAHEGGRKERKGRKKELSPRDTDTGLSFGCYFCVLIILRGSRGREKRKRGVCCRATLLSFADIFPLQAEDARGKKKKKGRKGRRGKAGAAVRGETLSQSPLSRSCGERIFERRGGRGEKKKKGGKGGKKRDLVARPVRVRHWR